MPHSSRKNFNPLPPHGGRHNGEGTSTRNYRFQSTPSAWRETYSQSSCFGVERFQSTPSAWRETNKLHQMGVQTAISIHSLRMEGDIITPLLYLSALIFQSTPSAWRETSARLLRARAATYFNPLPPHGGRLFYSAKFFRRRIISIHSLRMEGDMRLIRRKLRG